MRLIALISLCSLLTPAWAATPVTAAMLERLLIHPELSAPATVASLNDSRLSAELMARIEAIPVREGDRVAAGDLLMVLDCREHLAQQASQEAVSRELMSQLKLAAAQLERARRLKQQRSVSAEEVDKRETQLNVLRAKKAYQGQRIIQARLRVERCEIRAPFAGVVRERLAQVGELADPGTRLLRLQQLDAVEVSARLRPDQDPRGAAQLAFEYQGKRYALRLRRFLPVIDVSGRTREARFEFVTDKAPVGAAGRLVWQEGEGRLPADLLLHRQGQLGVMLVDEGRARFYALPGAIEGQPALTNGLPLDSRLVVEGRLGVMDGNALQELR